MTSQTPVRGPSLKLLTATISFPGSALTKLQEVAGLAKEEGEAALSDLTSRGLLEPSRQGYTITVEGLGAFYSTLGQIRDVLSPEQPSPSLPFTVTTTWSEFVCLNYLVDPERLRGLLSPVFRPVLWKGKGIVSVTIASLRSMRPRGLPEVVGKNFCHLTHRAVVEFQNIRGEVHRGYEFIESATNSDVLNRIGRNVTEFKFHEFVLGKIHFLKKGKTLVVGAEIDGGKLDLVVTVNTDKGVSDPPSSSAFTRQDLDSEVIDHNDAFGYEKGSPYSYVLRIDRSPWNYRFVQPDGIYCGYYQGDGPFDEKTAKLDSVLHCQEVKYRWLPLLREKLGDQRG